MSTQRETSFRIYIIVGLISALLGFGAIYVIAGPQDNGARQNTSSSGTINSDTKTVTAQASSPTPAKTPSINSAPAQAAAPAPALAGKGKLPAVASSDLSTGTMATFVFKDTPMAVPPFTFTDAAGNARALEDWRGKVVLLNLWATWCAPCLREMPHLDRLQAKLGSDKFEVLAISVDRNGPEKPTAFRDRTNIKHLKFYQDPTAKLGFALKVIGMPATLLLDTEGREIGRLVGPADWDSADAIRLIRAHFAD